MAKPLNDEASKHSTGVKARVAGKGEVLEGRIEGRPRLGHDLHRQIPSSERDIAEESRHHIANSTTQGAADGGDHRKERGWNC